ncbi:MAG: PilN domain-containing protein [Candidatus Omnitrophica bacterium]|nr:PilN domain-containing protein [Candidatus Omnitrophota bacterium]
MIEINLLPEELKNKARKAEKEKVFNQALYFMPWILGLLLFTHLCLACVFIFKSYQINSLTGKWRSLEPERKILSEARNEYELFSQDSRIVKQLESKYILWAQKLSRLSADLPSGIWFNGAVLSSKECTLKGSVVSLQKEEMSLVNKLIENLKNDALFFKDFSSLELSSVQMRTIGGYDVVDFILNVKIKAR